MTQSDKAFTGSIPAFYGRYLGPMLFEPYAADLAARVKAFAPTAVLETANGTGIVTARLVEVLADDAVITATDLNTDGSIPAVRVEAGDILVVPNADAHVLSSSPGMRVPADVSQYLPANGSAVALPCRAG